MSYVCAASPFEHATPIRLDVVCACVCVCLCAFGSSQDIPAAISEQSPKKRVAEETPNTKKARLEREEKQRMDEAKAAAAQEKQRQEEEKARKRAEREAAATLRKEKQAAAAQEKAKRQREKEQKEAARAARECPQKKLEREAKCQLSKYSALVVEAAHIISKVDSGKDPTVSWLQDCLAFASLHACN